MSGGRVLITGRYGFTGRYVAAELEAAGWEVWGTGMMAPPAPDPAYLKANLSDSAAIAHVVDRVKPDAVIHLAAIAFVAHGAAEDFYKVNVIGTRVLLEALAQSGVAQSGVILASSANIYGNSKHAPIAETTSPAPVNDYAVSKLAMEYMAQLFTDRLPIVIVRPFNYTGRGQNAQFLVPKIVAHFRQRAPQIELGNLDVARDFSDVRDVARAYRALLRPDLRGRQINICSGVATPLQDIVDMCSDITGHNLTVTVNPQFVRANEVKELMGDVTLYRSLTQDGPNYGLKETLEWMLT
ncbi:NAD-dependent epimerase/dehydratase family protein [Ruegeria sp. HKCCD6109]|nr:NAD-dependent epimerase/dehydratase family protein [Ruegeria sp. HKCCD6109]